MTENVQVCLLLGGATLVTVLGLRALPAVGVHDIATFRATAFPGQLHMLQPIVDAKGHLNGFSWLAVLLGYPILGIWYWCADQTHVQRVLAAHSVIDGQNGALFAGFLKITPVFLMVLPGVIGYVLWQKGAIHLENVAGKDTPDYNTMLPVLVNYLVPVGLRGLIAASMAAALMSCMAAALNSCATLISMDIVKRIRPETDDQKTVLIGRVSTGVIMVLAMLWSAAGDQFGTIFEAINKIPMTFAPAVTTVFVLGVLWKRGTRQAAMTTLYLGSIIGIVYFVLDLPGVGRAILGGRAEKDFAGLLTDPIQGLGVPFMLVGPMIAVLCVIIYILTSLLTPAMDEVEVAKVCWDHPLAFLKGPVEALNDPRIVSLLLISVVGALYLWLR